MGQIIMGWVLPRKPLTGDVEDYQENNCTLDTQVPPTPREPSKPQLPPADDLPPAQEPCRIFDCVNVERPHCVADACDLVGTKGFPRDF